MTRREDTVVSRLPNRFIKAATQVSQVRQMRDIEGHPEAPTRLDGPGNRRTSQRPEVARQPSPPRQRQVPGQQVDRGWDAASSRNPVSHNAQVQRRHPPSQPPSFCEDEATALRHTVQPPSQPSRKPPAAPAAAPRHSSGNVAAQRAFAAPVGASGKVIVCFGCRGGSGATMLSVNMAAELARAGKRVCVMDLDLQLGDLFVALDLEPDTFIAALAREAATIDDAALKRRLVRHDGGFHAITQVGRIDDIDEQLFERLPALLAKLTDHFDYVIVDGVRDFGDYSLAVLDMADAVALVVSQEVASVRRAARVITLFRQLGYGDGKLKLVLNRHSRRCEISADEVARALSLSVASTIRNDFKRVRGAMNAGAIVGEVARGSAIARDIAGTTVMLATSANASGSGIEEAVLAQKLAPKKRSLLAFWRRDESEPTQRAQPVTNPAGGR